MASEPKGTVKIAVVGEDGNATGVLAISQGKARVGGREEPLAPTIIRFTMEKMGSRF